MCLGALVVHPGRELPHLLARGPILGQTREGHVTHEPVRCFFRERFVQLRHALAAIDDRILGLADRRG